MDMKRLCQNQVQEALVHKWLKGQALGYDPGEAAIHEWIATHAKEYREQYNKTYKCLLQQVQRDSQSTLAALLGPDVDKTTSLQIITCICDSFTKLWVKEMAVDMRQNPHLDEI